MAEAERKEPETPEEPLGTSKGRALSTTELSHPPKPLLAAAAESRPPPSGDNAVVDPLIGQVLGGLYKIESRIGEGGMGTVYAAKHIHLGKEFAVKVLTRKIAVDKKAVERFRQEAVNAGSIDHDNIVSVVNFDTTPEGDVFIVMERLHGRSLYDVIGEGPLPLDRALAIAHQVAAALHAAHERDIVHRDLKPENVFIVRKADRDFVKILDFGISKVKSAEQEQVRMTKTGQLVGTPLYMSPEQARGEHDLDRRTDVYAMGVLLYEMLTGVPPFEGSNYFQLLWKHGNEQPEPPTKKNPGITLPPALEALILKALDKSRSKRFQTMAEVQTALYDAAPDVVLPARLAALTPEVRSTPVHSRVSLTGIGGRRPISWMAVVVPLLVGAAIVVAWASSSDEDATTLSRPQVTTVPPQPGPPPSAGPALSPGPATKAAGIDDPPTPVLVRFTSTPQGAMVHVLGLTVGPTPTSARVPFSPAPVEVRFERPGFVGDVVAVTLAEGAEVSGRLRAVARPPGREQTGPGFKQGF